MELLYNELLFFFFFWEKMNADEAAFFLLVSLRGGLARSRPDFFSSRVREVLILINTYPYSPARRAVSGETGGGLSSHYRGAHPFTPGGVGVATRKEGGGRKVGVVYKLTENPDSTRNGAKRTSLTGKTQMPAGLLLGLDCGSLLLGIYSGRTGRDHSEGSTKNLMRKDPPLYGTPFLSLCR